MGKPLIDIPIDLARAIVLLERLRKAADKPHWESGESFSEVQDSVLSFITDMRIAHGWTDDYEGFIPALRKFVSKEGE